MIQLQHTKTLIQLLMMMMQKSLLITIHNHHHHDSENDREWLTHHYQKMKSEVSSMKSVISPKLTRKMWKTR